MVVATQLGLGAPSAAARPFPPDQRTWVQPPGDTRFGAFLTPHGIICSGFFPEPGRFALAGHCLRDRSGPLEYSNAEIVVLPGYNISASGTPYKPDVCTVNGQATHPKWRDPGLSTRMQDEWDMGVLHVSCGNPSAVSVMGSPPSIPSPARVMGYPFDCNPLYVPGCANPLQWMPGRPFKDVDQLFVNGAILGHRVDASAGQSGAAVWDTTVYGIHVRSPKYTLGYSEPALNEAVPLDSTRRSWLVSQW